MQGRQLRSSCKALRQSRKGLCSKTFCAYSTTKQKCLPARTFLQGRQLRSSCKALRQSRKGLCSKTFCAYSTTKQKCLPARTFLQGRQLRSSCKALRQSRKGLCSKTFCAYYNYNIFILYFTDIPIVLTKYLQHLQVRPICRMILPI